MRLLSLLAAITFFIASCKQEEADEIIPNEITLIYPIDDITINPCCTNFQWSTTLDTTFQLTVATNDTFTNPLIDTLVPFNAADSIKQFLHSYTFEPGVQHHWRIKQGDKENSSSFTIKDVVGDFSGEWTVQISETEWQLEQGVIWDTSLIGTIEITKSGQDVKVRYPDNFTFYPQFVPAQHETDRLWYEWFLGGGNNCSLSLIYPDSIYLNCRVGSLGHGTYWTAQGRR